MIQNPISIVSKGIFDYKVLIMKRYFSETIKAKIQENLIIYMSCWSRLETVKIVKVSLIV